MIKYGIKTTNIALAIIALAGIFTPKATAAQTVHATNLSWKAPIAPPTSYGFNIYKCPGTCTLTSGTWTKLIGSINSATLAWQDTVVTAGSTYSYYVTAYDTTGSGLYLESAPSNIYTGTIPTTTTTPQFPTPNPLTGTVQ
jgi:hypothetical protein